MENKSHAIAAGLFVVLMATLLVALTFWMVRPGQDRMRYDVVTQDPVTGLLPQANVQFRGVKVGKVVDIDLDPARSGQVIVSLELDDNTPVTQTTYAQLDYQGMTGIAFVQLDDRPEPGPRLVTTRDHPARIPMKAGSWGQWKQQGEKVLQDLQTATQRVNEVFGPDNQKLLRQTLENINRAASALPPTLQETTQTVVLMRESATRVTSAAERVRAAADSYNALARTLQQPGGFLEQLQQSAQALAGASASVQQTSVPRLNHLMDGADRSVRQFGRTAALLNDTPQALIYGAPLVQPGPGEPGFVTPRSAP